MKAEIVVMQSGTQEYLGDWMGERARKDPPLKEAQP